MNKSRVENIKDTVVETSEDLAKHIYNLLKKKPIHNVLDVGAWKGKLSDPFRNLKRCQIIGVDRTDEYKNNFDKFLHIDFLQSTAEDFKGLHVDLVLSNPPFNEDKEKGELTPMLWLEHIFEVLGSNTPVVLIVGNWFFQSKGRMEKLNNFNVTRRIQLHKTSFGIEHQVEASVLFFNIKTNRSMEYYYPPKKKNSKLLTDTKTQQKTKTIGFNQEQIKHIESNFSNFSGEIKELIRAKYPDFP